MMRMAGGGLLGLGICVAVGLIGSDRWLTAGYDGLSASTHQTVRTNIGGDEAFWLSTKATRALEPAAAPVQVGSLRARAFDVGTRLTLAGADRLNLEIVSATPAALDSGLVDAAGRPLIVVTARERGNGTRLIRLLVEADGDVPASEKSL